MTKDTQNIHGNQQNTSGTVTGPVVGGNVGQIGDNTYNITHQPQPYHPPLQRPARADHFQDRTEELARLLTDLQPGVVVTLSGPGGMGKTALAAEAIWHLAADDRPPQRFPDGIFFHSFYNQPAIDAACENIVRSFGQQPQGSLRDNARRTLAGRTALLILDGTEDADDLPALLDLRDRCGVLITSRDRRTYAGRRTDLPPLPPQDSVDLIRAWAQHAYPEQDAVAETVAAIASLVGHLPMALRLVGSYLDESAETPAEYLSWLQRSPLAALNQGERRMESVEILLARTLARLSDDERTLLAVAGLLAFVPFDAAPVAHALDRNADELRPAFAQLVRYSLLVRDDDGRYQTAHALVHIYARRRLHPPPQSLNRLASRYNRLARSLSTQGQKGYHRLDIQRPHLMALLERCRDAADWETLSDLAWAVGDYLNMQGHRTELIAALELGVIAAQSRSDRQEEGSFLGNLGVAYAALGQVDWAIEHYTDALSISREIGDRRNECTWLGNLGLAYADLGQMHWATEYHILALAISQKIGDRQGEGNHLGNLGLAYAALGEMPRAIKHHTYALAISREIGDRRGEGNTLGSLGNAYYSLSQMQRAIEHYTQALAISREIGDRPGEGAHLGNLGVAYASLGQVDWAIEHYTDGLSISREIGDRRGESNHLVNLGRIRAEIGEVESAIDLCQQSLRIKREIGDRPGEGEALNYLGYAICQVGDVEDAIALHRAGIALLREAGYQWPLGRALADLAEAYLALSQFSDVRTCAEEALTLGEESGDKGGAGLARMHLGRIHALSGDNETARLYWQGALSIFTEIQSPHAATVRGWLASLVESS